MNRQRELKIVDLKLRFLSGAPGKHNIAIPSLTEFRNRNSRAAERGEKRTNVVRKQEYRRTGAASERFLGEKFKVGHLESPGEGLGLCGGGADKADLV